MQRTITNLNSRAIVLLERGENDGAIAVLRDAVTLIVQSRLQSPPSYNDDDDKIRRTRSPEAIMKGITRSSNFVISPYRPREEQLNTGDAVELFPYPFTFDLAPCPEGSSTRLAHDEFAFTTAVCLYNMALVHHRSHVLNKKQQADSSLLHRVLRLYQEAFNVLVSWDPRPVAAGSPIVLLLMALCKNMASVHYENGDLAQVKFWKSHLDRAMSFANPNLLDKDIYGIFRFSTLLMSGTDLIAARAA